MNGRTETSLPFRPCSATDDCPQSSPSSDSAGLLLAPRNEETPEGADRSKERSESALPQGSTRKENDGH